MLSSPSSRHNLVLSHSVFGPCVSLLLSRSTEKKKLVHRLTDQVRATWSCVITQRCHKQIAVKKTCQSRSLAHENPLCCKQFLDSVLCLIIHALHSIAVLGEPLVSSPHQCRISDKENHRQQIKRNTR